MTKTAIVIGSTGVVGRELIMQLIDGSAYTQIISFSRSAIPLTPKYQQSPKLIQHLIDFDAPESWQHLVRGDHLFCCIGTTLKQAGSKQKQREIDLDLPVKFANIATNNGCQTFVLVSSYGADVESSSFYLQLKGQLESAIQRLNFHNVVIVRPSLITGQRADPRLKEQMANWALSLLRPLPWLRRYRPITGHQVAKSMYALAQAPENDGITIKVLDELFEY